MGLKEVVKEARDKGLIDKDIEKSLLNKGYGKNEIDSAFGRSVVKKPIKNLPQSILEKRQGTSELTRPFMQKLKLLFSSPKEFFEKIHEKGIGKAVGAYFMVAGIMSLIFIGIYSIFLLGFNNFGSFSFYNLISIIYVLFIYLFLFGAMFLVAGIVHLTAKLFKGTGSYSDSFNLSIYSFIPAMILILIPIVGFLSLIYTLILTTFGVMKYHGLTGGKAFTAAFAPIILIVVFVFLFILYLLYAFGAF